MEQGPTNPKDLSGGALSIRRAKPPDLDAIVQVSEAGFPDDAAFAFKTPYRSKHPADYKECMRSQMKQYLDMKIFVVLMVTARFAVEDRIVDEPVAIGVWKVGVESSLEPKDPTAESTWKHVNIERVNAGGAAIYRGVSKYFKAYGNKQLHLVSVVTHPDFRRRGAGKMICNWIQKEAEKRRVPVLTVVATPMGKKLYEHLGYKVLGQEVAQVDGEDEKATIYMMEKRLK